MNGKGSRQRPTDKVSFDENFDRIFGQVSKECQQCGKLFSTNEGILIADAKGGYMICPVCKSSRIGDYK